MSPEAQPRAEPARALRLPERYRARRHLASGGMASVWCADDLVLGRTVAIKVLAERFAHDEMAVRRFKREARAAARVSAHPHVVTIFDVGDLEPDEDAHGDVGRAFIVMEHLTGGTVADAIRVGAVKRWEALRWLREAASALDHAHQREIVHRDIKPANFLLDHNRILHVADFGIARLTSEDTITSSGELFGTAAYLAPEQALGQDATSASDRYALAVAAFELLCGERPFTAPHFAAQARQHIDDDPPSASERDRSLPPAVDPVLIRGMDKQPEARYETAGALVGALEAALADSPTASTRVVRNGGRRSTAGALPADPPETVRTRQPTPAGSPPAARDRPPPASVKPLPPTSATPRGSGSGGQGSGRRGRGGRALPLAALLIAAVVVGVIALGGLGGSPKSASSRSRLATRKAAAATHHATTKSAGAAAETSAPSASPASGSTTARSTTSTTSSTTPSSAAQLQQTGHQQLLAGSYPAAIATLRNAVSESSTTSLTYAYALYDLGRALLLGGDPSAAVAILEQRLKIPNQTALVQQALDQALRASGQAPARAAPSKPSQPTPSTPAKPGKGPAGIGSGGAALGPPEHGHHHGR
jgi:serine/threonine protein kinase